MFATVNISGRIIQFLCSLKPLQFESPEKGESDLVYAYFIHNYLHNLYNKPFAAPIIPAIFRQHSRFKFQPITK